ncbi:hypothetical protein T01_8093 [Trichinella spiralis]|uniref:Uncharacterized protein n=1 Tax=Trichinella spiralis TaxID=6334 RepID=A0A0V1BBI2_TRISP|nr:hypothetical protein T01_8093 [Trichinella spiralis]
MDVNMLLLMATEAKGKTIVKLQYLQRWLCSKVLQLVTQHAMGNGENELFVLLPMASCSGCKSEWRNAV